jgi:large subunit ribosomal protein L21
MYAIFKDGGKQYKAEKGQMLELERKPRKDGETVEFTEVLVVHDGEKVKVGTPLVPGAKVVAEIVKELKGDKIRVFKFRRREGYHRTVGHRQRHTLVKVTDIVTG